MKVNGSKKGELSLRDIGKVLFLIATFFGGFYIANTDLVNAFIGQHILPEHVGIVTTFIAYFFKQLMKDNTK